MVRMQRVLASAAIDARRGGLQRQAMQPLFAGRDELITLLARTDPTSADRLADLFVAYRKIMSG